MLKIKEYVKAESLEQAYELNQKKMNRIIGGMMWMKMSNGSIQKAIDLSGLGLDKIEETDEEFSFGCMVTLRQIELHESFNAFTQGSVKESICHLIGVQFRNLATIGGSIYGRFGFSDLLTSFLGLDAYVELYKAGIVPLEEFAAMKKDNDILVRVIVKKTPGEFAYLSHRNTKTDFPTLTCMVAKYGTDIKAVIGATPSAAKVYPFTKEQCEALMKEDVTEEEMKKIAKEVAAKVKTGSNMRGSAEYRTHLAGVLIRRGLVQILKGGCA